MMWVLVPALLGLSSAMVCPDGDMCESGNTCCKNPEGDYVCCPLPRAECCSDHLHCCYEGTVCDLVQGRCVNRTVSLPWRTRLRPPQRAPLLPQLQQELKAVVCPDGESECPDGTTCCQLADGSWGCCQFAKAVCCEDKRHCCPEGTTCDLEHSKCVSSSLESFPMLEKEPARKSGNNSTPPVASVSCPGGQSSCPDQFTCCLLSSGAYGCCPYAQAVCCDDHEHCCPHATVCNLPAETCDDPTGFSPPVRWLEKTPAVTSETCDEQTACRGGTTCCKKRSGQWACCPVPQAVCCDDHEHCCPGGYACNVAARSCIKPGALGLPWLHKVPALRRGPGLAASGPARPDRNMCDAQTSCPRDTTCCFMAGTRRWGCCPLPRAVCCEDGLHCCPGGHACEPHRAACSKGPHVVVPWVSKLSATSEPAAVTDVKCDDKSSCASGTTCCKLQTGEWGCCPLVKAVCCADREHCCPQGYTCNMQTGTCEKTSPDALHLPVPQIQVVRPDAGDAPCGVTGEFHCAKQDTCCRLSASEWACCPSPQAVCCPDSKHCCPAGYSCDPAGGCSQRSQLTWDALTGDRRRDFVPRGL